MKQNIKMLCREKKKKWLCWSCDARTFQRLIMVSNIKKTYPSVKLMNVKNALADTPKFFSFLATVFERGKNKTLHTSFFIFELDLGNNLS
jgi:hypothetical protein